MAKKSESADNQQKKKIEVEENLGEDQVREAPAEEQTEEEMGEEEQAEEKKEPTTEEKTGRIAGSLPAADSRIRQFQKKNPEGKD
jgi:hypothetical protein